MFSLTSESINKESLISSLKDDSAGALVIFEGWIRDHNQGKAVSSLEYQVYDSLAKKEGAKILHEAKEKFNLHKILCTHRFGHLTLGETAVWIGATATHRDDAFKATRFVIDQIKLRLPIWKKEHYLNENPQWVFCKDHLHHVHFSKEDYYQKQNKLIHQNILKNSKVLVVGAGGLGCPALMSLSAAGVGQIDIVDFDKISLNNIHRQHLYSPDLVGEKKVTIAKSKLRALNPFVHIHGFDERLGPDNVEKFITGKDLILDCTDNLETKFLLHDACFKLKVPLITASIYQFEGQIRTFDPRQELGCLRCTLKETPDDHRLGNCNDFGILGSSVATLGNIAANEAILFLQNKQNSTLKETFYFNLKNLSQMKIKNIRDGGCKTCKGDITFESHDLEVDVTFIHSEEVELVDIRDEISPLLDAYKNSHKKVVIYCHKGIRSKQIVKDLRHKGFSHFYSLKGGACSL